MVVLGFSASDARRKWVILDQHSVMLHLDFVQNGRFSHFLILFSILKSPIVSLPFNLFLLIALTKQRAYIDFKLHRRMWRAWYRFFSLAFLFKVNSFYLLFYVKWIKQYFYAEISVIVIFFQKLCSCQTT